MIDLNETTTQVDEELSSKSTVLGVLNDLLSDPPSYTEDCCSSVIAEKYVENKTKQMWVKGPVDDKGFFTLRNPHTGKLLTGKENKALIVKPGVYFNNRTKHFDFSGALPRGTKVGQILSKGQ